MIENDVAQLISNRISSSAGVARSRFDDVNRIITRDLVGLMQPASNEVNTNCIGWK